MMTCNVTQTLPLLLGRSPSKTALRATSLRRLAFPRMIVLMIKPSHPPYHCNIICNDNSKKRCLKLSRHLDCIEGISRFKDPEGSKTPQITSSC